MITLISYVLFSILCFGTDVILVFLPGVFFRLQAVKDPTILAG